MKPTQMQSLPTVEPQWLPIVLGNQPAPSMGLTPAQPAPCFPFSSCSDPPRSSFLLLLTVPSPGSQTPSHLQARALAPATPPKSALGEDFLPGK